MLFVTENGETALKNACSTQAMFITFPFDLQSRSIFQFSLNISKIRCD